MTIGLKARPAGLRSRQALLALVAALPLAACQHDPMSTASMPLTVAERHPIGVEPERVVLDVPQTGAAGAGGAAELQSFVLAYGQEGNGPLYVLVPSSIADRRGAEAVYAETRRIAHNNGVPVASIQYASYDAVAGGAPVKLLYERLVSTVVCGQWPDNASMGPRNHPYYNYGCATQRNFAAMLENPADLDGPRASTPRDGQRRDTVYENYRQGTVTTAESATDDAASASEVGE